jgi:hypothetical protein
MVDLEQWLAAPPSEARQLTLVTNVPARKNTMRSAKNTLQGWMECAIAVTTAAAMPRGVREFRVRARYTSSRVTGTETSGFMALWTWSETGYAVPGVRVEDGIKKFGGAGLLISERLINQGSRDSINRGRPVL